MQPSVEHKKLSVRGFISRVIFITIGAIIMAFGLEGILIPNDMIDGGVTGISIILSDLTGINLGVFLVIINLPFFLLGFKRIGKRFAISMLYGILVLSITTSLLHHIEPVFDDLLLATIFGGLMLGVGIGIVMRSGGVLDGSETLAILLDKRLPFSVGEIIMIMNVIIFSIAGFVYGLESALYSMLAYFIAFKTIDIVVEGLNDMKTMHIISDFSKDIGQAILVETGRGVTYLNGEGGYHNEKKQIILCVFTRLEETAIRDSVLAIDPDAFMIVSDATKVRGGNFKKKETH